MKIFICLKISQLYFCKQPYTLIDIKELAYEKFFVDSVVTVHRPLQYCGVRFEKRISSRTSQTSCKRTLTYWCLVAFGNKCEK